MKYKKVKEIINEEVKKFLIDEADNKNSIKIKNSLSQLTKSVDMGSEIIESAIYELAGSDNNPDLEKLGEVVKIHNAYLAALQELAKSL